MASNMNAISDSNTADATGTDPAASDGNYTTPTVSVNDLISREQTLAFCGLVPGDDVSYPDTVKPTRSTKRLSSEPLSFKEVVQHLPTASSGDLYANNRFVGDDGNINTAAIRDVDGLDIDAIEQATGMSIESIATGLSQRDSLIEVSDHKDIIDERRLALSTLGLPVKFRWQIASDQYCIVNPPDAYLPAIEALQEREENDVFGWAHYRDWGGVLKMSFILPSLQRTIVPDSNQDDEDDTAAEALQERHEALTLDIDGDVVGENVTIYGGFQTGYDFRGSQTMWARPLLYIPADDSTLLGMGQRYSRRHVGSATDAAHERKNDRVPINEWWENIYDEIRKQTTTIDKEVGLSRLVGVDFAKVPYSVEQFYVYLGIAGTYAEEAADRAKSFASPPTSPSVWNLQISLLITLNALYEGSHASDTYQSYNEVAEQLLRRPTRSIQLALKEHDRQTDRDTQLPADQQTLSNSIGDLANIPGINVESESDLSNADAQRVQEEVTTHLQQKLGDL
jgi:hypothetical protein